MNMSVKERTHRDSTTQAGNTFKVGRMIHSSLTVAHHSGCCYHVSLHNDLTLSMLDTSSRMTEECLVNKTTVCRKKVGMPYLTRQCVYLIIHQ